MRTADTFQPNGSRHGGENGGRGVERQTAVNGNRASGWEERKAQECGPIAHPLVGGDNLGFTGHSR